MVTRYAVALVAALGLSSGCSRTVNEGATALLVVVEADPGVRGQAMVVNVTTRRPGIIGAPTVLGTRQFVPGPNGWPFTFVVQAQNPAARVEVIAEVVAAGNPAPISVARAITAYAPRQSLVVPLMLWSGCGPSRCGADETCLRPTTEGPVQMGDCTTAQSAPSALTPLGANAVFGACGPTEYRYGAECRMLPMAPMIDGGIADAATDAPVDSAPADASGDDGGVDAGPDAPDALGTDLGASTDASDCGGPCARGSFCVRNVCGPPASCEQILESDRGMLSGVQSLRALDGTTYQAYCEQVADGGGWTLVLKASGASPRFAYSSSQWTSAAALSEGAPGLDTTEAKLASFGSIPFADLRIVFRTPETAGGDEPVVLAGWGDRSRTLVDWMRLPTTPGSLGVRRDVGSVSMRYARWVGAISSRGGGGLLDSACVDEGFNLVAPRTETGAPGHSLRIGILADDDRVGGTDSVGLCPSPNSRIGVGGEGVGCSTSSTGASNSVGNVVAPCDSADTRARDTRSFAWVFVR